MSFGARSQFLRVLLVFLAFFGLLADSGHTLCVGADGHAALEHVAEKPMTCEPPAPETEAQAAFIADCCGPCSDSEVRVWAALRASGATGARPGTTPTPAAFPETTLPPSAAATRPAVPLPNPQAPSTAPPLLTIALLR